MGQTLDLNLTQITPKALQSKAVRSGKVFALHKAAYVGQVLPRLRRTEYRLEKAMEGADPLTLTRLSSALCQVVEQRRVILRIPSPGRDAGPDTLARLPSADVIELGAQAQAGEVGQDAANASTELDK